MERNERLPGIAIQPTEEEPLLRKSGGGKELPCIHCKLITRTWIAYSYNKDHPDGTCLCQECHAAGLTFPYEDLSQKL
jgi:hypothetical protein